MHTELSARIQTLEALHTTRLGLEAMLLMLPDASARARTCLQATCRSFEKACQMVGPLLTEG